MQVVDWRDCWTAAKETKLPLVIKAGGQPGTPNGWILAGFDMRPREEGAIDLEIVVLPPFLLEARRHGLGLECLCRANCWPGRY